MGGAAVYYMGYYGYGTSITGPDDRAIVLARFDGVEALGSLIGTAISNVVFVAIGYYGSYSIRTACMIFSTAWIYFYLKEPVVQKEDTKRRTIRESDSFVQRARKTLNRYIWTPLKEMTESVLKRRQGSLRLLLYIQLFVYSLYWFNISAKQERDSPKRIF
jgi:hypothetical protein